MKTNSFYSYLSQGELVVVRLVGSDTNRNGQKIYRVWKYAPYAGVEEPTLRDWTVIVVDGEKFRYMQTTTFLTLPDAYSLVAVSRQPVEIKDYWAWSKEEFSKKVRAISFARPRYSSPKYKSQEASKQQIYLLYVNEDTLQLQSSSRRAQTFRSENESQVAKQLAYDYIKRRATELGWLDPTPTPGPLLLRARALQLQLVLELELARLNA